MIIETFKDGDPRPIRERFVHCGRMLPEGVSYHGSWIDPETTQCYQVMEAPDLQQIQQWTQAWDDLVDFEIIPVLSSQDYWNQIAAAV